MKLGEVLSGCEYEVLDKHNGALTTEISGIAYDSRKVTNNGVFVAVRGEHRDGHDFVGEAIEKGAVAVVGEKIDMVTARASFVRVNDSRRALACIANNFYKRPSEGISVVGITGTNGKTTTSYLIKSILETWGKQVGLIGTIAYSIAGRWYPALHTTPESVEFQGLLREMTARGCSHVVTEVSSHSLSQRRVDYTKFAVVVFTNLTRDHLDFHETMENYYVAKERLFTELLSGAGTAVINVDDQWGRRLLARLQEKAGTGGRKNGSLRVITYGIHGKADVTASEREDTLSGVSFMTTHKYKSHRIDSPLVGTPNLYNILAATAACLGMDVPMSAIQEGIRNVLSVSGRLEKVDAGQDFFCIIDYAHTPDALERLILTARDILHNRGGPGRIITLFGCGGDRDRGKRPVMGEVAARLSDYVIITSDNPRGEDPGEIIKEIAAGMTGGNYRTVPDRKDAIALAVEKANAGDILLVAGKGHEDYQEIRGVRHRFSDRAEVEEAIKKRLYGQKAGR